MKRIAINDVDGIAKTIVSGYYKFGTATHLFGGGSTGTVIMEVYESDGYSDEGA